MNRNLFRHTVMVSLISAAVLTLMAAPAMAQDAPTVKSIDVSVDIAAVKNEAAAKYWGQLETDLEGAILAKV